MDAITSRIYTWEETNGHSVLSRIDPETGLILQRIDVDERTYIRKPQIRDGVLYFLYRETREELPRKINRMVLPD